MPFLDERIAKHILEDHEATLHPPGQPDGKAIGGVDEDLYLVHSIYFPNCDNPFGPENEVMGATGNAQAAPAESG